MKKLITITLILAMLMSAAALAETPDPIVGAWYLMLDYSNAPQTGETKDMKYSVLVMIFEEDGTLSCLSGDSTKTNGLTGQGAAVGTWQKNGGAYTVNIIGSGSNRAELKDGRLLVEIMQYTWYSMRPLECGSWYSDIVVRYQ